MPDDVTKPRTLPSVPLGIGPATRPILTGVVAPDYDNTLSCIRCGLCLSVCPTYNVERSEVQSPRGRVALIRAVEEARLPLTSPGFKDHMYHCLDCRACQTICPSGVKVGEMVLASRSQAESAHQPPPAERLIRGFALRVVLTSAKRLSFFTRFLRLYQVSGLQRIVRLTRLLERLPFGLSVLATMEELLPPIPKTPLHEQLPTIMPAEGEPKHRVGFFLGCMMSVLLTETSRATVEVLARNKCEVITPPDQMCCGAPHVEEGDSSAQIGFARRNVDIFSRLEVDYIVTDCAACGAETKGYGRLLAHDPEYAARAAAFSAKIRDITELLVEIGVDPPKGTLAMSVTYHEPCHLCHAQGIRRQPREVLNSIPGSTLIELPESDWCCGSAGVYNITHAERAEKILQRKIDNLRSTGAEVVATGNPGCLLQLEAGVKKAKMKVRVAHPVVLLAEAYRDGDRLAQPSESDRRRQNGRG